MKKTDSKNYHFGVSGFTSIQIGIYLLLAAYLIKSSLDGYLIDSYTANQLSQDQIELFVQILIAATFIFSVLTLYVKGLSNARKIGSPLWNERNKKSALLFVLFFIGLLSVLYVLQAQGLTIYVAPTFLIGFAIHSILQRHTPKEVLLIPGLCILLAFVCILIPGYWYASTLLLGVAYITKGINKK